jgi:hypothetical protein
MFIFTVVKIVDVDIEIIIDVNIVDLDNVVIDAIIVNVVIVIISI